jgi:hypothetical protein
LRSRFRIWPVKSPSRKPAPSNRYPRLLFNSPSHHLTKDAVVFKTLSGRSDSFAFQHPLR